MNRLLQLSGLFIVLPFASFGQGVQSSVYVNRVFTRADTLQALHDIFRSGRRWGRVITALAPVAAGVAVYSHPRMDLGISLWGSPSESNGHFAAVMIAAPATVTFSLVGPLSWSGNSKKMEQETIRNYEAGLPLLGRVQRQLHRRLAYTLLTTAPPNR